MVLSGRLTGAPRAAVLLGRKVVQSAGAGGTPPQGAEGAGAIRQLSSGHFQTGPDRVDFSGLRYRESGRQRPGRTSCRRRWGYSPADGVVSKAGGRLLVRDFFQRLQIYGHIEPLALFVLVVVSEVVGADGINRVSKIVGPLQLEVHAKVGQVIRVHWFFSR